MAENLFRRTTFLEPAARAAAKFYVDVFGWKVWYDNELQVEDPKVGMLGLLQYLAPPFDTAVPTKRSKVRMGEAILVIETKDIDGVHSRALAAGANVVTPPVNWKVPSNDGKGWIQLRSMSMFDPNGIYMEVKVLM